jgi:hypothetical protein
MEALILKCKGVKRSANSLEICDNLLIGYQHLYAFCEYDKIMWLELNN